MSSRFRPRRALPPLSEEALRELALRYAGRYATTRARLRAYLARKLRERGWDGPNEPDLEALANGFAERGYVDDVTYALDQARSLSARGYGKRRLADKLRLAGIDEEDREEANAHAERQTVHAALRFAERRRMGPYATEVADRMQREKWIAAMVRAGHGFALARALAAMNAGEVVDLDELREKARLADA